MCNLNKKFYIVITLMLTFLTLLISCAVQQNRTYSSVIDYLYPDKTDTQVKPSIPQLELPINVGIAFVPEQKSRRQGLNMWAGIRNRGTIITEAQKINLLDRISDNFKKYKFVDNIELIPSAYLTPGGGFINLDQIKTMYGVDVIALVSFDQVQFTDEGALSLTYWTIVGAYIFTGEKNDTSTLMDTVVFDISSRKMLFRAPGVSNVKGTSTVVNLSEELRKDSTEGFEVATIDLIKNLDFQLQHFRKKVKEKPEQVKVTYRPSYGGGGGSLGIIEFITMSLIFLFSRRTKLWNRST